MMKISDLDKIKPLVGSDVRVTVVFEIHGWKSDPETYEGRLIAIGRKQGPSRHNTMPYCLVIDATDSGGGVPIIAIRSVASVDLLTATTAT